jgi:REP-associated tyrosine transposase
MRSATPMPRRRRYYQDGLAYHVINRGNKRSKIFLEAEDGEDFLDAMADAGSHHSVGHLTFCLMPNHWHLVLWPECAVDLSAYMQRLMNCHIRKYQKRHGTRGTGHLYQGRFKSFPIEDNTHLLAVCRYVEANPVRAGLVSRAEDWKWSGLTRRALKDGTPLLSQWPVPRPANWLELVNLPTSEGVLRTIREVISPERRGPCVARQSLALPPS